MKKAKKVVALALCAVLLVVGSVTGTMAYLTSQDEVVNTFTVGNVNIILDEYDYDSSKTDVNENSNEGRDSKNEYKLIPGKTYPKDPMVTVLPNSESSYVRMIVTISDLADLKAACGVAADADFLPQNFVQGWDPTKWKTTNIIKVDGDTATYEFRYYTTVSTGNNKLELEKLFTSFTMPSTANNAQMAALDELQIDVKAHAIQADGFTATDDKTAEQVAWDAFDKQMTPVTGN